MTTDNTYDNLINDLKQTLGADISAAGVEIVFGNSLSQKFIALLRTVSPKCCIGGHLIHGFMECFYTSPGQGMGDIADSKPDDG